MDTLCFESRGFKDIRASLQSVQMFEKEMQSLICKVHVLRQIYKRTIYTARENINIHIYTTLQVGLFGDRALELASCECQTDILDSPFLHRGESLQKSQLQGFKRAATPKVAQLTSIVQVPM